MVAYKCRWYELVLPIKFKRRCNDEDEIVIFSLFYFLFCALNSLNMFKCGLFFVTMDNVFLLYYYPYV